MAAKSETLRLFKQSQDIMMGGGTLLNQSQQSLTDKSLCTNTNLDYSDNTNYAKPHKHDSHKLSERTLNLKYQITQLDDEII